MTKSTRNFMKHKLSYLIGAGFGVCLLAMLLKKHGRSSEYVYTLNSITRKQLEDVGHAVEKQTARELERFGYVAHVEIIISNDEYVLDLEVSNEKLDAYYGLNVSLARPDTKLSYHGNAGHVISSRPNVAKSGNKIKWPETVNEEYNITSNTDVAYLIYQITGRISACIQHVETNRIEV